MIESLSQVKRRKDDAGIASYIVSFGILLIKRLGMDMWK